MPKLAKPYIPGYNIHIGKIPAVVITSPILLTCYVLDQRDRQKYAKSEWQLEPVDPYAVEGRFGAPKVTERFQQISLIALAQLSLPKPINLFLPDTLGNKKKSVSVLVRNGSTENFLHELPELEPSKLSIKASKYRKTSENTGIWEKSKHYETYEISTESSPLVEAKVKIFFDKELSRKAVFTERSWVQIGDLPAITQIMGSMEKLKISQDKSAEISCVYQSFLEMELIDSESESAFSQWLGEYQLIPSLQEEIPLVLPAKVMKMIDGLLKTELMDRRLGKQPTLIPCYEWLHDEISSLYALEIIMKTKEKNAIECHRFRLFSIEKNTIEALRGNLEGCNINSQYLLDSSLLLYVMYCGFWDLGMPADSSYKIASGKAVLSSDEPSTGYYKFLEFQASKGTQGQHFLDWEWTEKGKESHEKVKRAAYTFNFQFFQDPLFKEYRHQYYLALSLAKLQNSVESKKAHKRPIQGEDLMQYESASLRAMLADNGLPWPETFELSKEIFEEAPQIQSLQRELERLPFSKTAKRLVDLYFEMQKICMVQN